MRTKLMLIKCGVLIVILCLVKGCDNRRVTTVKHGNGGFSDVQHNYLSEKDRIRNVSDTSAVEQSRGFFGHGGIFTLGKVLNFFPVGGERECRPASYTVARAGICLNPYDCRQRDGKPNGDCAHGLGVCCVFEVTCGGTVQNNLTYFVSPGFPELWTGEKECTITIEKAFAGIMQLRIDFVHFAIGQPNRMTGACDEDAMIIGEGRDNFTVCGQNHGQHIYYTLPTTESREAGELPRSKSTRLTILMRGSDMPRLWLLRLAQMPLANSAPHNCLQYFTGNNGTIKTFNYARNGRHLASQQYRACVRKSTGHCAIRYTPCDSQAFRIAGGNGAQPYYSIGSGPGGLGGPGTGFYGQDGSFIPGPTPEVLSTTPRATTVGQQQMFQQNDTAAASEDQMMEADGSQTQQDEMEGSGADPQIEPQIRPAQTRPSKSLMQVSRQFTRWSPYTQHFKADQSNDDFRYTGYGHFGLGLHGFGRLRCRDRITIPCENEYFLSSLPYGPGVCDPHHCGNTFCPGLPPHHCRVETSITPFAVSVHFGPPAVKRNPEENIGACLRYQQIPCDS